MLTTLLESGADPCCLAPNVPPPLHLAAMFGSTEILKILLKHGASLNLQDFVQYTALHCAAYFGHEQVVIFGSQSNSIRVKNFRS